MDTYSANSELSMAYLSMVILRSLVLDSKKNTYLAYLVVYHYLSQFWSTEH